MEIFRDLVWVEKVIQNKSELVDLDGNKVTSEGKFVLCTIKGLGEGAFVSDKGAVPFPFEVGDTVIVDPAWFTLEYEGKKHLILRGASVLARIKKAGELKYSRELS